MKCRACGQEHSPLLDCGRAARLAEFHAEKAAAAKPIAVLLKKAEKAVDTSVETHHNVSGTNKHGRYATKEARNAYQRKYMADRRAAKKAAKTTT